MNQLQMASQLLEQGKLQEVEVLCKRLLQLNPHDVDAMNIWGLAAQKAGAWELAIKLHAVAVREEPTKIQHVLHLAPCLVRAGRPDQAEGCYRRALELEPNNLECWCNLGVVLVAQQKKSEARAALERALSIDPAHAPTMINLANLACDEGQFGHAIELSQRAIRLDPENYRALGTLATAYQRQGEAEKAIALYRQMLALRPNDRKTHSNLLMSMLHTDGDSHDIFQEHRDWAGKFADRLLTDVLPHKNNLDPDRRLKIGYVSADFHEHPVAMFMEPILQLHDPGRVETFCYYASSGVDDMTNRLESLSHNWRSIAFKKASEVAQLIRDDGIDILVDLSLHSVGNRLHVFALKPAPIQATYLAYAFSSGMLAMDYRITDVWCDPPGATEEFHTEKLLRLPKTYWVYRPSEKSPPVAALPCDSNGYITFGSANRLDKYCDHTLQLWRRVLDAVPNSRMKLKFKFSDDYAQLRITAVLGDRVDFEGEAKFQEYLQFFNTVDICLDTFPFHGGTTTINSLWMGVPVITRTGELPISRVGASILMNLGLSELVVDTDDQFVKTAVELACDPDRLRRFRASSRAKMQSSPLMDEAGFVRELENAYSLMWREFVAKVTGAMVR